jgi:hypothetical protein
LLSVNEHLVFSEFNRKEQLFNWLGAYRWLAFGEAEKVQWIYN